MSARWSRGNSVTGSRFLHVFVAYTTPNEWVTARELALRMWKRGGSQWVKEVSRKLSNLERTGLVERRASGACFVYAKRPAPRDEQGVMPP